MTVSRLVAGLLPLANEDPVVSSFTAGEFLFSSPVAGLRSPSNEDHVVKSDRK